MARPRQPSPAQRRRAAVQRRDGALTRLSGVTAGIGIAAIAAVGALGVYVGRAIPGHHVTPTSGAVSGQSRSSASSSATQGSINPPSTPTQNASVPAPVTSGAS